MSEQEIWHLDESGLIPHVLPPRSFLRIEDPADLIIRVGDRERTWSAEEFLNLLEFVEKLMEQEQGE